MVVLQRVICMVCVPCGGVAACYIYGLCTVWRYGSVLLVWCLYGVVMLHRVISMVCVDCDGLAACYMYGVCTVWLCVSLL